MRGSRHDVRERGRAGWGRGGRGKAGYGIALIPHDPGVARMELARRIPLLSRGVLSARRPHASSCPAPGSSPGVFGASMRRSLPGGCGGGRCPERVRSRVDGQARRGELAGDAGPVNPHLSLSLSAALSCPSSAGRSLRSLGFRALRRSGGGWRWRASAVASCYPDHRAVHVARRSWERGGMMCRRRAGWGRGGRGTLGRGIAHIPHNPGKARMELTRRIPLLSRGARLARRPPRVVVPGPRNKSGSVRGIHLSFAAR